MTDTGLAPDAPRDPSPPRSLWPGEALARKSLPLLALLGLYALGVVHWGVFFHWGNISFMEEDWPKEFHYYALLQDSLRDGAMPYHMSAYYQKTTRFLGLPEINVSPQVLLLPFFSVGGFFLLHVLLLYSVGFIGLLLIRRRYRLRLLPFALLFFLFNFNGFITAHLCVGHSMWAGYFLLSFFLLYQLEMLEAPASYRPALKMALVLFALMLQGAFHMTIWCWLFLFLVAAFNPGLWRQGLAAFVFSGWLSSCRLLPAAITFWGAHDRGFWSGYSTVTDVLDALIVVRERTYPWTGSLIGGFHQLRWWEYDMYMGLLGLALIVYYGVLLRRNPAPHLASCRYARLDGPLLVMAFLSLNYFYMAVTSLPIPLFNAEGVTSRFLILPLLLLTAVAAIRMQRDLESGRKGVTLYVFLIGAVVQTAFALAHHSWIWRVVPFDGVNTPDQLRRISKPDPVYVASLYVAVALTLTAAPAWVYAFRRAKAAGEPASERKL